jgi:hypothetical protein
MKAVLEFDLNDPDDAMAHLRATMSTKLAICLCDIQEEIRKKLKYEGDTMEEKEFQAWENMNKIFFTTLEENGIILDDLII